MSTFRARRSRATYRTRRHLLGGLVIASALAGALFLTHGAGDGMTASPEQPTAVAQGDGPLTPSTVPDGWLEQASTNLARREYQVSTQDGVLQAPNRRQDLRTRFLAQGVEVEPRVGSDRWRWSWTTVGHGRDRLIPATAIEPRSEISRVTYTRPGLSEWYENREDGLEQGFTIGERPDGEGPLRVVGRWGGDLEPRPGEGGIDFIDPSGAAILRYDKLVVWDDTGRRLDGEITVVGNELSLAIDDRGAVYPVTVDPVISGSPWVIEGDQYRGYLGDVIAPAGDVNGDGYGDIIVGSPDYTTNGWIYYGHAFLYYGGPNGPATDYAWDFRGEVDGADFGVSVACAGDVNGDGFDDIIVGEPGWDDHIIYDGGRAWLWYGSADGLDPDDADEYFREDLGVTFGHCVGSAGDLNGDGYDDVFVCNWSIDRIEVAYGSADGVGPYVTDWGYTRPVGSGRFAYSACGAGDLNGDGYDDLVVGDPYHDGADGGIFVFLGSASGLPSSPDASISPGINSFFFGTSVAAAGDIDGDGYADLIVGCPTDNDYCTESPQIRIHRGSDLGLESDATWIIEAEEDMDSFGYRAICGGDVNGDGHADVVVRTGIEDDEGNRNSRVMLYLGGYSGLAAAPIWSVDSPVDEFFHGVNSVGDVNGDGFCDLAIGDIHADVDHGRIDVYPGGSEGPREAAGWVVESNQAGCRFGTSVAAAGDVNGDGFDDVLVGAPYYDYGQVDEGAVFLFPGSNQGLSWLPIWWAEGNADNANLGYAVASAGDVNGDGLCDVLAGAPGYLVGGDDVGAAFVWQSDPDGIPAGTPDNASWAFVGTQDHSLLGHAVDCAGDVNGDGYSDVIVGAHFYDNGTENEGAVWAFHGSSSGLSTTHDWFHDTNNGGCGYGWSVAGAGDVDGDGYGDVLVGAPFYNHPATDEGLVFLYRGSEDGLLPGAPWWYAECNQPGAYLGYDVDSAGDINGDGYADVICGAPYYDASIADDVGAVFLWYGGPTAPPTGNPDNADWRINWLVGDALLGHSVAGAGDLNGDGYGDVVAGCPWNTGSSVNNGFAVVFLGGADGMQGTLDWLEEGTVAHGLFGSDVSSAGDINGDGFSDLLISAEAYTNGQVDEGRTYVYYGNDGRGLPRSPRQWQEDFAERIGPLGCSDTQTGFGLTARGRTAAGRDEVRLEYEVKPMGLPFDGTGLVTVDAWTDTGEPLENGGSSVDLSTVVGGLSAETGYRWRVRVRARNPYFPSTPWLHHSWNGASLLDLRTKGTSVGVNDDATPASRPLVSNYPNPFNPRTCVKYNVPQAGAVRLRIYDPRGRLVRTLVDAELPVGRREVIWTGDDDRGRRLASGVYLAVLETAAGTSSHKVSMVK